MNQVCFELKKLPYKLDALSPFISEQLMILHYGAHYDGYIKNVNNLLNSQLKLISQSQFNDLTEVVLYAYKSNDVTLFRNAAQAWNHEFFWNTLSPKNTIVPFSPTSALFMAIQKTFGSFDDFITKFQVAAKTHFGSGWVWLVCDNEKLAIVDTHDANTPITNNLTPLMVIDVWEHAYYLDYHNKRANYIEQVMNNIINWDVAIRIFDSTVLAKQFR